ncbi:MAG: ABC transporter ATP-binding protein [Candidatus Marinimicrobia bacterium]|nr:ABC transporter ATP-binding protein [Candidatus Neomarinimicrobiota bacterium]MCF7829680.1 ABC transporter ATP-binding protein [Candidatus Neomarinimicrobiota bacterium]MCF7879840.1 ABC transporter ATP-binding protein [Candidatus Neomarinimicrobiota bacterium]
MEASISLNNVSKQFQLRKVLKQVSFGVEKGTIFYLAGPSGSGKTTLLKILTTLIRPDNGTIYIQGLNLETRSKKIRTLTGYVSEENTLNPELTVFENLRLHGVLSGLTQDVASTRAMRNLDRFHLVERAHDYPPELSYGMQRRVVVARAMLHRPEILFLDEPTTNVDPDTRDTIWRRLQEIRGETTIFITARDLDAAEEFADRIIILAEGEVVIDGTADSLRTDSPRITEYLIRFKSANPQYEKVLESIEAIASLEGTDGREFTLQLNPGYGLETVLRNFNDEQIEDFAIQEPSLNDIMMDLIRRKMPVE